MYPIHNQYIVIIPIQGILFDGDKKRKMLLSAESNKFCYRFKKREYPIFQQLARLYHSCLSSVDLGR